MQQRITSPHKQQQRLLLLQFDKELVELPAHIMDEKVQVQKRKVQGSAKFAISLAQCSCLSIWEISDFCQLISVLDSSNNHISNVIGFKYLKNLRSNVNATNNTQ